MNTGDLVQVPCHLEKVKVPLNGGEPQETLMCVCSLAAVEVAARSIAGRGVTYVGMAGPDDSLVHLFRVGP